MSGSDAIIVGEGWISEHYFTTDAKAQSFQARGARAAQGVGRRGHERPSDAAVAVHQRAAELGGRDLAALGRADRRRGRSGQRPDGSAVDRRLPDAARRPRLDRPRPAGSSGPVRCCGSRCRQITERAPLAVVFAARSPTVEELLAKDAATLLEPVALTEDGRRAHLGGPAGLGPVRRRRRART